MFPFLIRAESGIRRADLQAYFEAHGVDTRMVWTGNALRSRRSRAFRIERPTPAAPTPTASWSRV